MRGQNETTGRTRNAPVRCGRRGLVQPLSASRPSTDAFTSTGRSRAELETAPGDILGFENAGAYGCSMSLLGFMSLGAPTEHLLDGNRLRPITPARD